MSGSTIGGVVGAVIGFYFGNPQLGWMIGSAIGGAVDPETIQGPKIGDVAKQTSAEGVSRPIVFARSPPIGGNVIADGGPEIVKRTESGKGGPEVETESAYRTYAIGICEGPNAVLLQAWRNGQLVYDIESPAMADDNALFMEYARWFSGDYDQMPSPDLESVYGAGNVSAFRGTAYIVFHKEDVTDNRGSWSQWQFRVGRYPDQQAGLWWGVAVAESFDPSDRFLWRGPTPMAFGAPEYRGPPNISLGSSVYSSVLTKTPENKMLLYSTSGVVEAYSEYSNSALPPPVLETIYSDPVDIYRTRSFANCVVSIPNERNRIHVRINGEWSQHEVIPGMYNPSINRLDNGRWIMFVENGGDQRFLYSDMEYPVGGWTQAVCPEIPSNAICDIGVIGNRAYYIGNGQKVFETFGGQEWTVSVVPETGTTAGSCSKSNGDTLVFGDTNDETLVVLKDGEWYSIDIGQTTQLIDYGNGYWCASGADYQFLVVSQDAINWTSHPTPIIGSKKFKAAFATPFFNYRDGYYPLALIIQELAERVTALPYIDTSQLSDYVCRGFTVTNSYPASSALSELSKVFFFSPSNENGVLTFTPLGGDAIEVISNDQMIESDSEVDPDARRADAVTVPRVLHLVYHDILGALNTDKQRSEKPEGPRAVGEQQWQTTVILSANEAATVNAKFHAMQTEQQKGELNFALPDNYLAITESDPVIVQYEGKSVRCIIQMVNTDDGEQSYKALRDRQSIHTMQVQGIPPAVVTPPPSRRIGPTLLEIIDGGPLNDLHDVPGFYVAISGLYPAWQGALIELSLDGGATYIDSRVVRSGTIMGTLTASLGDHPQPYPDQHNTFSVSVSTPDVTLEATDLAGMLNGRNLCCVGNEFIQFADAVESSDGIWGLGYLIRGRKGSDTSDHEFGERFVMLNGALFVPAQYAWRGQTLTLRATSLGTTTDQATIKSFVLTFGNQIERRVGNLTAHKSGTNLVVQWEKVGRLGAGASAQTGLNYIGSVVQITDGSYTVIYRGNGPDDTETYTTPLAPFSGPITITAYQRNRYTNVGPPVEIVYANP